MIWAFDAGMIKNMTKAKVYFFSDVLCIWAYVALARVKEMHDHFGDKIDIDTRFCSIFSDAHGKIEKLWEARGGFEGFNAHLMEVGEKFPHVTVDPRIWIDARPRTSTSVHAFLKAVQIIEEENCNGSRPKPYMESLYYKAVWKIRCAFFERALDVSAWEVQREVAENLDIDPSLVSAKLNSSEALARVDADYNLSKKYNIEGSPTFVMNDGRQKLYGNVGYRVIEANIEEMLHKPDENEASWC